ncbi:MAG: transglutaminase protein [Crocinitomicaceae bacterium]|jgi:transglutaminase-like putative cysteine protease|nr:transglutaminase protein [Crocinitomicaceae bacterium]
MQKYLRETAILNFSSPEVQHFLAGISAGENEVELAKKLYFKVRDAFLYDPYHLDLRPASLQAGRITGKKRAWCVEKAVLLAACARSFGIPSRLGFAIVTNHIGVEKLLSYLGKEEIVFHGYVELYLENKWVKCTPAFDRRICAISGVSPLDWDGRTDSMFQEFEGSSRFMEYRHFYGEFDDVPVDLMNSEMKKHYPHLFEKEWNTKEFSFFHL